MAIERAVLKLGFIALADCAPLVAAREKGFFARHGLEVHLERQASWASVRDKVATGALDGAHMLAAMPLAATLGLEPVRTAMIAPLGLNVNGGGITVSNDLFALILAADPDWDKGATGRGLTGRGLTGRGRALAAAHALRRVLDRRRAAGEGPLTFAIVSPFSTHNYFLRYWLAAAGIDPDRDVRLVVVPPAQMVANLSAGHIAAYCVGEPWNARAVLEGLGQTLATSHDIWANGIDKVFAVTQDWAERHPGTLIALLMALIEAAQWADHADNRAEMAAILSEAWAVNAPEQALRHVLSDSSSGFSSFRFAATFPWLSQAEWYLTQMIRWGQLDPTTEIAAVAQKVFRPDYYRAAARAAGFAYPTIDRKPEGLHDAPWILSEASSPLVLGSDLFLDGRSFPTP